MFTRAARNEGRAAGAWTCSEETADVAESLISEAGIEMTGLRLRGAEGPEEAVVDDPDDKEEVLVVEFLRLDLLRRAILSFGVFPFLSGE